MLVLSRLVNQEVVIGEGADAVRVMVIEIKGDKVRLGFAAPRHIPVNRDEVDRAIKRERERNGETPEQCE